MNTRLCCLLLIACPAALSQSKNFGYTNVPDLRAPIRAGSPFTYADLLRQVCPTFKISRDHATASVSECVPIRLPGGEDQLADTPDENASLQSVRTLDAKIPGKPQLLLMFQIKDEGDEPHQPFDLALFEIADKPRLLDVVEAPSTPDDTGDLWSEGLLHLSPTADAFVFETNHSNSQQGYRSLDVFFAFGGRIQEIADVMLLSCRGCEDGNFDENVTIATAPDPGREYNRVTFRVTLDLLPDDPGVEHPKRARRSRRLFLGNYRWDAAMKKFTDPNHALDALDPFNKKNY